MNIYIDNHKFHYEIENLCRLFFPNSKLKVIKDKKPQSDDDFIYTNIYLEANKTIIKASVKFNGKFNEKYAEVSINNPDFENECERQLAIVLFLILVDITGIDPPWGILTGIRPVKLMRRLVKEKGFKETSEYFKSVFKVSDEKTNLCCQTMLNEQKIIDLSRFNSFSLYVSIPFCPSRCAYCSFVSQSIEKAAKLIPEYVKLLCQELEYTAEIANELQLRLESVYIGGGTPTTLSPLEMSNLLETIRNNFDMKFCREFTVEAGRPDTITDEILSVLKNFGVSRISINPQTLNDNVLKEIGRKHTAKQTIDAFNLARKYNFDNINMDLIAGLPNESYESFTNSVSKICEMAPEGITVHTLSMKKASNLTEKGNILYADDSVRASNMLRYISEVLNNNGYIPYYLYRQSRMVGNLENVGWAKKEKECLYNVYVMDETHTILACGAGAVTKLKQPDGDYLERIFNYKFPYEYISSFDEMLKRKGQVRDFYEKF